MKIVVDLLACQTQSRFRGIGRYTHSLVTEMAKAKQSHKFFVLANTAYSDSFMSLRQEFTRLLPAGSFLPYEHFNLDPSLGETDPNFEIASTLVRHAYEVIDPDIVLYPSIFEGWGEKGIVPLPKDGFPSSLKSVILYDFVPFIFADRFLEPDPYFKQYYLRRFNALKEFDLILAISESTRQDAIKYLGISPDKVVNISAAASSIFQKQQFNYDENEILLKRFGIIKPFVFYTGNVEFHKNMDMALKAYAQLPCEIRANHQFVLTHTGEESAFRKKLDTFGLANHEIITTGHVSDQELVTLYNTCKLYIFPSLYEGFGLPVLEAMACGAPVIASNNSSIPEVMGREDAMFNASNQQSISELLHKSLTDDDFRLNLSTYGLERVKLFSWEKSAQKAWDAFNRINPKR